MKNYLNSILLFLIILLFNCNKKESNLDKVKDNEIISLLSKSKTQLVEYNCFDSSLIYAYQSLEISIKSNKTNLQSESLNQIGRVFLDFNKLDSAEKYLNRALLSNTNIDINKSKVFNNLGKLYIRKNEYQKSTNYYIKSYEVSKSIKDYDGVVLGLNNIGENFRNERNFSKSEFYYLESLKYIDSVSDKVYIGDLFKLLGGLYYRIKKYDQSIHFYKKSIIIYDSLNYPIDKIRVYNNISIVYNAINDCINAEFYAIKGYNEAISINDQQSISDSKFYLANTFFTCKKFIQSKIILDDLIQNFDDISIDNEMKYNLFLIASKTYKHFNQYKLSLEYLEKSNIYNDSVLKFQTESTANEIESRYQSKNKQAEILTLQNKNLKESRIKWVLASILVISLIGLGLFYKLYQKIKGQKSMIENLQKELHHRIKNNLTIINKFIEDIKNKSNKENIDIDLTDLQNKIESINTVHKQLYDNSDMTDLNLKYFIDSLAMNVANSFNKNIQTINAVDDKIQIEIERSFPLGLIINEFITNSYKHGFKNIENPTITIKSKMENNKLKTIELSDNGIGFNIEKADTKSIGLRLISLLSRQMDSQLEMKNDKGTKFILNFA